MKKLLLITALVSTLGSGFIFNAAIAEEAAKPTIAVTEEKTVTLDVPGMFCPTCPFTVRKSLEKVDGVKNVKTSSETKTAVVTYDTSKVKIQDLIEATTNVGYPSSVKEEDND